MSAIPVRLLLPLVLLAGSAQAQVSDVVWEDPTLPEAVQSADLVVRAKAAAVTPAGVRYEVEAAFKGRAEAGQALEVVGLHHPDLRDGPPVSVGERAYLVLRGDPKGPLCVPTPTFGRFPLQDFGKETLAVVALLDTYVRLPLAPARFEQLLTALGGGEAAPPLGWARGLLDAGPSDTSDAYLAASVLAMLGGADDVGRLEALLRDERIGLESSWRVRRVAAQALGRAGGRRGVELLLGLAGGDAVAAVRAEAALSLLPALRSLDDAAREAACRRLGALGREATVEEVRLTIASDPRTNGLPAPLAAQLDTLARLRSPAGVPSALRGLERQTTPEGVGTDTSGVLVAALTYFELLGDASQAPAIAQRMRDAGQDDVILNRLFASALELLTGKRLGPDKAAWLEALGVQPQGPPSAGGQR